MPKLEVGDKIVTRSICPARQAHVDAHIVGVVINTYMSYGTGINYDVTFVNCMYHGRWTGLKTWCCTEDMLRKL